ncbi:AraC-like DNA-binding protein [Brevundimonas faecalis]|uniref:AraC-like DNA-binding protein n=1 Tax=Brevundimonas faecalis TaxID=947378 RepID=A0ABV2R9R6_9CAUL
MVDPLSDVIRLLRPRAVFTKGISGAGAWAVRYSDFGDPSFCAVTEGRCRLSVDGQAPIILEQGDFVLLPATPGFTMSGFEPATPRLIDPRAATAPTEEVRHGDPEAPAEVRMLGGYFLFDSPDAALLVALLPALVHVRGVERLTTLVRMLGEEAEDERTGQSLVMFRLIEILLVEALRSLPGEGAAPGLLRGLADRRIAAAMRRMHGAPAQAWTVSQLAQEAGMSRSAFFDRFTRAVGLAPMEYLLTWRMAVAKRLLRRREASIDAVAEQVGYGSASTFSTAFRRHVGEPPGRYARAALVGA